VGNTDSTTRIDVRREERRGAAQSELGESSSVGDTSSAGCSQHQPIEVGLPDTAERYAEDGGIGEAEPVLGGDTDGISYRTHSTANRVSRLKALGNAIVPQVAMIFANAIYQLEADR
jgi:hypothetical protein